MTRGIAVIGVILALSLAVNLFLAGGVLGLRMHRPPSFGPEMMDRRLESIWRRLPDADKPIAQTVVGNHRDEIAEKWRRMRESDMRASAALRADPFDSEATKAAFAEANLRSEEYRKALRDTVIEAASKISPEGRTRLQLSPR